MRKELVVLVDDLTGEEADDVQTVEFGLDGVTYEIDLHEAHANELREALSDYVSAARRTGGRAKRGTAPKTARQVSTGMGYNREQSRAIREWGRQQGWTIADRGRIPEWLATAWEDAHQGKAA